SAPDPVFVLFRSMELLGISSLGERGYPVLQHGSVKLRTLVKKGSTRRCCGIGILRTKSSLLPHVAGAALFQWFFPHEAFPYCALRRRWTPSGDTPRPF